MSPKSKSPKPARKHVTTACNPCREGKVKCDGATPACGNCGAKGKRCSYRQVDDRRKIPVRVSFGVLARRINQLVLYIQGQGLELPCMDESDSLMIGSIFDALGMECYGLTTGKDTSTAKRYIDDARSGEDVVLSPDAMPPHQKAVADSSSPSTGADPQETLGAHNLVSSAAQPPNPSHETGEDEEDEVTSQLSCRSGRLQVMHDGQLRYYGSTSNLNLLDILVGVTPPCSTNAQKGAHEVLKSAELDAPVDETFEQHLLKLYFTWQDPCLHVVDEQVFWRSRAHNLDDDLDTPYYSFTLVNAMCAIGAAYEPRYHPSLVTFPRSLAEFFGDRAKVLLELELESPSLATVQALVILGGYEASCTRDTRGWLYSGMAMRLAFDLGLHLDMAPYVAKGIIPLENAEIRRLTFWGAYMSEQFWGWYLGRHTRNQLPVITVKKLDGCNDPGAEKWEPYGSPTASNNVPAFPNTLKKLSYEWTSLYDLPLPLTDVLYDISSMSIREMQELAAHTVEKLKSWKADLPAELDFDESESGVQPLPHVLALHMQYHQMMIHCHRPYISHVIQPQPPQGPGSGHARMTCIESAISIARLLALYERCYSFRRANYLIVSFVFSAALILIFITVPLKGDDEDQELMQHLNTCFRALDEMGSRFENARRTNTFLTTLQCEWQTRRRDTKVSSGTKRKLPCSFATTGRRTMTRDESSLRSAHDQSWSAAAVGRTGEQADVDLQHSTDLPSIDDGLSYSLDLMESDLCNILLSEGIPRAFV
ncbi:uncharacterized protein BO95DRAFT_360903 [Aspergillus brunneoviolaceus CBS 621.78]|uniref:Uncharacterized protein n=1 Tax=Aspergillus brunneoviolaceus CBS 621.78 TaxID=1450534 RepID=A0ACD1GC11_9EURO|nr:hypothetical protein BO95DRAFT_360903 [Aspergillus brunneoviolaceus CBS 621.78]RAH46698.1 hypothetical protein BO95DRAFT_360903 [Aspergillus brunneoviolaceus CBS 621.78]